MIKGDREAFYAHELKVREEGGLPPFGRLAALIVSANEHDEAFAFARRLLSAAPMAEGLRLFGPADAPLAMVRGRHRVRLLVQSPKEFDLSGYVRFWLNHGGETQGQSQDTDRYRPDQFLLIGALRNCRKTGAVSGRLNHVPHACKRRKTCARGCAALKAPGAGHYL